MKFDAMTKEQEKFYDMGFKDGKEENPTNWKYFLQLMGLMASMALPTIFITHFLNKYDDYITSWIYHQIIKLF